MAALPRCCDGSSSPPFGINVPIRGVEDSYDSGAWSVSCAIMWSFTAALTPAWTWPADSLSTSSMSPVCP